LPTSSDETELINIAEYYLRSGQPVPIDILSRLLEAGVDIKKYN
jgi:hypothetical protein